MLWYIFNTTFLDTHMNEWNIRTCVLLCVVFLRMAEIDATNYWKRLDAKLATVMEVSYHTDPYLTDLCINTTYI